MSDSFNYCCAEIDNPNNTWLDCQSCEKTLPLCNLNNNKQDCNAFSKYCAWSNNKCINKPGAPNFAKSITPCIKQNYFPYQNPQCSKPQCNQIPFEDACNANSTYCTWSNDTCIAKQQPICDQIQWDNACNLNSQNCVWSNNKCMNKTNANNGTLIPSDASSFGSSTPTLIPISPPCPTLISPPCQPISPPCPTPMSASMYNRTYIIIIISIIIFLIIIGIIYYFAFHKKKVINKCLKLTKNN